MNKLLQFILEQAEQQPISRRIALYRALLDSVLVASNDHKETRQRLLGLTESLEQVEKQSAQILFEFSH